MEKLNEEYKKYLEDLPQVLIGDFLNKFKAIESYKLREEYLNKEIATEILNIWNKEEFVKIYYLDTQANYILKYLNLNESELKSLKTLVYCYNTNQREFKAKIDLNNLEKDLFNRGFKKISIFDDLKKYDGIKGICVMDISKIGLLGSFDKKEELTGKLVYSEYQKSLMLIPKRSRTRGFIIKKDFYFKWTQN